MIASSIFLPGGQRGLDLHDAEEVADVVEGLQVVRVGHHNREYFVLERQRQHLVERRHRFLNHLDRVGLRHHLVEVDDAQAVLLGDGRQQLVLGDEAAVEDDALERRIGGTGVVDELLDLGFVEEAEVHKHGAELAGAVGRRPLLLFLGGRGLLGRGRGLGSGFRQ